MSDQGVTAIIYNTRVNNLRVMSSRMDGRCDNTGRSFKAGTEILYKSKGNLTPEEVAGVFTARGKSAYSLVAIASTCEIIRNPANARDEYRDYRNTQKKSNGTGITYDGVAKKPNFPPSVYQKNILAAVLNNVAHVLIRALAGSGKTTTLVWLLFEMLERGLLNGKRAIYLAFNVNIKNELLLKLQGTDIPAKTTHSFAMGELLRIPDHVTVMKGNAKSQLFFLKAVCDRLGMPFDDHGKKIAKQSGYWEVRKAVYEVASFIKNWAVLPAYTVEGGWQFTVDQVAEIDTFIDRYKIPVDSERRNEVVDWACTVISLGTPQPGESINYLDYDDMLFLPLVLNVPIPKYDYVLSDESQDFNKAQLLLLEKLAKAGARIISVGDSNQGLYRFRGAAGHSMEWLGEMFLGTKRGLETCDLPVNYRSDKAIIRWANQWVPDLLGSSEEEGEVSFDLAFNQTMDEAQNDPSHSYAFLCRTNLPLVVTAYKLIAKKKRIHILGRDSFAGPILGLIADLCGRKGDDHYCNRISDRYGPDGAVVEQGLLTRLSEHMATQRIKLAGENFKYQLEALENHAACIEIIASNIQGDTVGSVYDEINNLFADSPEPGVINLATIHGAKGLEWDTVYIVRPDLLPHPIVKEFDSEGNVTEEYQQEINACYVAATRAKHRLRYILNWPFGKGMGPVKFLPTAEMVGGNSWNRFDTSPMVDYFPAIDAQSRRPDGGVIDRQGFVRYHNHPDGGETEYHANVDEAAYFRQHPTADDTRLDAAFGPRRKPAPLVLPPVVGNSPEIGEQDIDSLEPFIY